MPAVFVKALEYTQSDEKSKYWVPLYQKSPIEYGAAVSEFRPIMKDGEVVTVLELDYNISFVKQLRWRVTAALLISPGLAVIPAGVFALVLSGSLTRPIAELADHARQIGGGDPDRRITVRSFLHRKQPIVREQR